MTKRTALQAAAVVVWLALIYGYAWGRLLANPTVARVWYFDLGRCAPAMRDAAERKPDLWAQDVRIGKCRAGESNAGPVGVCLVDHRLPDGMRRTDTIAVDCSAGTFNGVAR